MLMRGGGEWGGGGERSLNDFKLVLLLVVFRVTARQE